MQGTRIEVSDAVALVMVDEVSDEFKAQLRERLSDYCYGAVQATEDAGYYSFEKTITELLIRYDSKRASTRIGMAGELLVHTLVTHTHPTMSSAALFLNKEERSIKKGFDLTFHTNAGGAVWYGEVKSGMVGANQSANAKSAILLQKAASDIADKLGGGAERSRWDSAISDAAHTLEGPDADSVKSLLRSDCLSATGGGLTTKNVVVAAVVMHPIGSSAVGSDAVRASAATVKATGKFTEVAVLVAQQHELESVISYLREVAASA